MNIPLFRLQGLNTSDQRYFMENLIQFHNDFQLTNQPRQKWGQHGNEFYNMTYPASKVTTISYTMTLQDFHHLFIGRINQTSNEQEVIHVAQRMASLLHSKYPQFIQPLQFYLNCKNDVKYLSNSSSVQMINNESVESIQLIGISKLTKEGDRLLRELNISCGNDCQRIAEFRSRLTYLSFSKLPQNADNQNNYLEKIINEYGHFSVLDACQAIFQLPNDFIKSDFNSFNFQQTERGIFLFLTLKQIRQALLRSTITNTSDHLLNSIQSLIQ
jgi:thymidylate synthase ThyX